MKTIGVFDSGVGGQSVANAIKMALPSYKVVLREDKANLPYGNKKPAELLKLVEPFLKEMSQSCDVIVVACNTVSTTIISELRQKLAIPLISMEPMVKPAAEITKTGVIAVCATPTTLNSKRYKWLKDEYAKNVKVIEPDCSQWASMIEDNQINETHIKDTVTQILSDSADVIVLGCTHYHWIEDEIKRLSELKAKVLQPEQPVIKQLKKVLERRA